MGNPPATEQRRQPRPPGPPDEAKMRELRELLVGPEKSGLEQLQQRLDDPKLHAREIAFVLPQALALRAQDDNSLVPVLQGTVEQILKTSVKKNPEPIIEALFPIIGPAIRRAITGALRGMMQSLENALNHSISPQSLKWRLEAWRTGKPFAEVVLLQTLRYRVEQVYLIHRESGLVLQHVRDDNVPAEDPALVSGMLTALQDFARDSFHAQRDEDLETLEFGDLTVLLEQGPDAVIAGIVRGNPPPDLRFEFQRVLEEIHRQRGDELNAFDGDDSAFAQVKPQLETCLHSELLEGAAPQSKRLSRIWWLVLALVFLVVAAWAFSTIRENLRWSSYLETLKGQPGIVVTEATLSGNTIHLAGLKDPLSADPGAMLEPSRLSGYSLDERWEPYHSFHPQLIERRAQEILAPPPSLQLAVAGQTLSLRGEASIDWLAQARARLAGVSGVTQLDVSNVSITLPAAVRQVVEKIERTRVGFEAGSSRIQASQNAAIRDLRLEFSRLEEWARQNGTAFEVQIRGHTDPTGSQNLNSRLALGRAEAIRQALLQDRRDEGHLRFSVEGVPGRPGLAAAHSDDQRSVTFSLVHSTSQ